MSREKISAVLAKYLPQNVIEECTVWIIQKNIHLKITRGRASKFGDYRPLAPGKGHRITVNHDLNPYSFLITFIHEVAHLQTYIKHNHYHEPHGKEWKNEFRILLNGFILRGIFPDDIRIAVSKYANNPAASSCSDHDLLRVLRKYDTTNQELAHLEDLPENSVFRLNQSRSGLVFRKGHKIRRRYHCLEINSNKVYFVSPLAEVLTVE